MNIYVYSDESGVFDYKHNNFFVYGGLIFLDKNEKDICTRKFLKAEKIVRKYGKYRKGEELKANRIRNKEKSKLFRSLNRYIKFGAIIEQKNVNQKTFGNKKSKQRYLDYVYKISLKRALEKLIFQKIIIANEVKNIYVFIDEHTMATDGRYELKESLEQEFKIGTINFEYNKYYPPIFTKLKSVELQVCNSESKTLVRAADIVANRIYYKTVSNNDEFRENTYITRFP